MDWATRQLCAFTRNPAELKADPVSAWRSCQIELHVKTDEGCATMDFQTLQFCCNASKERSKAASLGLSQSKQRAGMGVHAGTCLEVEIEIHEVEVKKGFREEDKHQLQDLGADNRGAICGELDSSPHRVTSRGPAGYLERLVALCCWHICVTLLEIGEKCAQAFQTHWKHPGPVSNQGWCGNSASWAIISSHWVFGRCELCTSEAAHMKQSERREVKTNIERGPRGPWSGRGTVPDGFIVWRLVSSSQTTSQFTFQLRKQDPYRVTGAGSWVLTPLSVYREKVSDRWETDLIMFSFFPSPLSGRFVLIPPAFKPQRYMSPRTQTLPLLQLWAGRSRAGPPRLTVTFTGFQKMLLFVYELNQNQLLMLSVLLIYFSALTQLGQALGGMWECKHSFIQTIRLSLSGHHIHSNVLSDLH